MTDPNRKHAKKSSISSRFGFLGKRQNKPDQPAFEPLYSTQSNSATLLNCMLQHGLDADTSSIRSSSPERSDSPPRHRRPKSRRMLRKSNLAVIPSLAQKGSKRPTRPFSTSFPSISSPVIIGSSNQFVNTKKEAMSAGGPHRNAPHESRVASADIICDKDQCHSTSLEPYTVAQHNATRRQGPAIDKFGKPAVQHYTHTPTDVVIKIPATRPSQLNLAQKSALFGASTPPAASPTCPQTSIYYYSRRESGRVPETNTHTHTHTNTHSRHQSGRSPETHSRRQSGSTPDTHKTPDTRTPDPRHDQPTCLLPSLDAGPFRLAQPFRPAPAVCGSVSSTSSDSESYGFSPRTDDTDMRTELSTRSWWSPEKRVESLDRGRHKRVDSLDGGCHKRIDSLDRGLDSLGGGPDHRFSKTSDSFRHSMPATPVSSAPPKQLIRCVSKPASHDISPRLAMVPFPLAVDPRPAGVLFVNYYVSKSRSLSDPIVNPLAILPPTPLAARRTFSVTTKQLKTRPLPPTPFARCRGFEDGWDPDRQFEEEDRVDELVGTHRGFIVHV